MKSFSLLALIGLAAVGRAIPAALPRLDAGGGGGAAVDADVTPFPDSESTPNPACWAALSCSFAKIEASSMKSRLRYVRYMQKTHFQPLKSSNQFRSIEAVIDWFIQQNFGAKGTWVSYIDAGIVEAIQRGGALALGKSTATGGNPGSKKWETFLRAMQAGTLQDRDVSEETHTRATEM